MPRRIVCMTCSIFWLRPTSTSSRSASWRELQAYHVCPTLRASHTSSMTVCTGLSSQSLLLTGASTVSQFAFLYIKEFDNAALAMAERSADAWHATNVEEVCPTMCLPIDLKIAQTCFRS